MFDRKYALWIVCFVANDADAKEHVIAALGCPVNRWSYFYQSNTSIYLFPRTIYIYILKKVTAIFFIVFFVARNNTVGYIKLVIFHFI